MRLRIDTKAYAQWRNDTRQVYASETVAGKTLLWTVNGNGHIRVTHGDEVLYEGYAVNNAIKAWDTA